MRKLEFNQIRKIVEEHYELNIRKVTRQNPYPEARFMYFKLCMDFAKKKTLASIGASLKKDHATVLHGIKTLEGHMFYDDVISRKYKQMANSCKTLAGIKPKKSLLSKTLHRNINYKQEIVTLKNKIEEYETVK